MKIYTRGGDQGNTSLWPHGRVPKSHIRIETVGALDELNAALGVALAHLEGASYDELRQTLVRCQQILFHMGAEAAEPDGADRVRAEWVQDLESGIDRLQADVPPLDRFLLPGGHRAAAFLHVARTAARRAERAWTRLAELHPGNPASMAYLNRLSDYLFVAARFVNAREGVEEPLWKGDS